MDARYKPVGGVGNFQKWDEVGQEIEGIWRGVSAGKFGEVGTLETEAGLVQFSLTAVLKDRLGKVRVGGQVCIEYTGEARSKAGTKFKTFDVGLLDEADLLKDGGDGKDKDEVPF